MIRGSLWSLFGGGGQQLISLLLFLYLARLLTPADIGLIAFAMVFVDLAAFVFRCGQVELVQQREGVDDRLLSTSFWMLAAGGTLASATIAAAAAMAPAGPVPDILVWLAPICALHALNALPEAILKRGFQFRPLAVRTWIGTLTGGAVAVAMVQQGYGVEALVGQRLSTAVVQTLALWVQLPWRPLRIFDRQEARRLVREGGRIMLAGCAGILNQRVTDSIVAATLGATPLGYLKLSWRFFEFALQFAVAPVSSVALSSFSRMQADHATLCRAYLRLTQFVAVGAIPLFFGFGAIADIAVPFAFGEKWSGAVVLIQMLGLLILPGLVNFFFGPAMIAVGKSDVVLRQSIGQVLVSVVLVTAGSTFGIAGVMGGIVVRVALVSCYNLHALRLAIGLAPRAVFTMLLPPATAASAMVAALWWAKAGLAATLEAPILLLALVGSGTATYGLVFVAGDLVGLWPGYLRSALESLRSARRAKSLADSAVAF